ncbi:MAG TPA: alpha/beta hydrolase [Acetobacteraceae bacterium]|nr:alpha/beta hydrolase [Acetobacteraceae bacterium]
MATIVLIHGAYQGGWIWQRVVSRLTAGGHLVFAPSLDGCAERRHALRAGITTETHGAEIAELLFFEDLRDVVLVGTSSGGMVVCKAAELARERIGRLVLADALALFDGECIGDIVKRTARVTTDLASGPSREDAAGRMFASLDDTTKAWTLDRYTPHPVAAMNDRVKLPHFWQQTWKASVIWCRQAANPGEAHQRRAAEKLGGTWHELDTGHYPMLTAPDELAKVIVQG